MRDQCLALKNTLGKDYGAIYLNIILYYIYEISQFWSYRMFHFSIVEEKWIQIEEIKESNERKHEWFQGWVPYKY